jgi:hypothetical protein
MWKARVKAIWDRAQDTGFTASQVSVIVDTPRSDL